MNSKEIRDSFLIFFKEKDHKVIPSSSLIPHGDPTLLLTTAGMVQIKPYFLGSSTPPKPRLVSCQKCFRTTDIESVGDDKHLTFFEMLGNFSVGDYFKKEAIAWGWEYVTERLKLPAEKLWVTVFLDDDEAFDIWRSIGVTAEKIVRLGEKDNFWGPAGDSGPCGPCSEIHYDFGANFGCGKPGCDPSCSCSRFSEIWNLVFMQYNQNRDGSRSPLPKPNIDTGMGLERVVAVIKGNPSVYATDLFAPLLQKIGKLTGKKTDIDEAAERALKIIAEHSRGITFLIADGLLPSNEGRGYILRRILRRACFLGRKLGLRKPFISEMADVVIDKMGVFYPELVANQKLIFDIINNEEEKFIDTLDAGVNLCEKAITDAKAQGRNCLLSEEVFRFWDTYGFPLELSAEIAGEHGMDIDHAGVEAEMEKQRERTRSTHKFTNSTEDTDVIAKLAPQLKTTTFSGYDELASKSKLIQIIDNKSVQPVDSAKTGSHVTLILDRTPFYGEMGGQVGDTGIIRANAGEVRVTNAVSFASNGIAVTGYVEKGTLTAGDTVEAVVDDERRHDIARNHTSTHLLQMALRKVLGSHVSQRGSLVAPDRLRFDFTHLSIISKEQLKEVQSIVNSIIRKNLPVIIDVCPYSRAISEGAIALFEEKYGDTVRMVKIGDPRVSTELCGGTHVRSTGEIGTFLIINEASIGTGLRRIESVTGRGAESYINEKFALLEEAAGELKSMPAELPAKIKAMVHSLSVGNKTIASLQKEIAKYEIDTIIGDNLKEVSGVKVLSAQVSPAPMPALMQLGDLVRDKLKSAVIVLATVYEDKPYFMATITPDLVARGLHSGKLIKKMSEIAGGSGGGKAEMAQAGAKDREKVLAALSAVTKYVEESIKA